ncbi:hypothetical protein BHM03_00023298 [Ensete ventricosum]|uniref:Uncharacterized protein n=1 Tax=Ensete ventricosum TaxID=4639 RepID=A0A445MGG9_ENSVE|nr:hypothetical protein BHM03_00023298 [Ensete ventricosum]
MQWDLVGSSPSPKGSRSSLRIRYRVGPPGYSPLGTEDQPAASPRSDITIGGSREGSEEPTHGPTPTKDGAGVGSSLADGPTCGATGPSNGATRTKSRYTTCPRIVSLDGYKYGPGKGLGEAVVGGLGPPYFIR